MQRHFLILVALAAVLPLSIANADARQYGNRGTAEQQRACRPDVLRHCRGIEDDHAIEACLRANVHRLRPACREVFERG